MTGGRDPGVAWERQPGEGREAFVAFKAYRDLPPRDRSIDAAFAATCGHQKGTKRAAGNWKRWSVEHEWVARAEAYDRHLRDVELAAQEEAIAQEAARWHERRRKQREDEWEARTKLLEKVNQMLQLPVVEQVVTSPDGRTVVVKPARWTLSTVAQLLDTMAKLGRLAAEMDTAQQRADLRLERDYQNALAKLERELPPDVYAQVLRALAGESGADGT